LSTGYSFFFFDEPDELDVFAELPDVAGAGVELEDDDDESDVDDGADVDGTAAGEGASEPLRSDFSRLSFR
jgi:hypothetical protein